MKLTRILLVATLCATAPDANAFVHVVRPKETLADIAKRLYGDSTREGLLAGANALDVQGGSAIVPGMHLQIPACDFHRVGEHETWASIARDFLGDDKRADYLARANDALAWIAPSPGQEVRVPYVLTYIAAEGDTTLAIARKYLGDANKAWELDAYNGKKDWKLLRGEVVLVPISSLELTDMGRAEALGEDARGRREAGGATLAAQRKAAAEIPLLLADVRAGRYVDAVARGNRLAAQADLSRAQLASIDRALVEAYVALDAAGPAAAACDEWHKNEPGATLDPVYVSPKIRDACRWAR
jgi:LysM repeat protein